MHLLHNWANEEQIERYLVPLAKGETFSAFSMTEPPPGAGSDPRMIKTQAERDGDDWIINGHKWLSSNGEVADFFIIMAVTNSDVHPYQGCTQFLAPRDTPGIKIVRDVPVMGSKDFGGHVEIRFENLRLPESAILGGEGQGFMLAQSRLGPARLTHCMRWTGIAQRALEIATAYAAEREAFGGALTSHQAIQWMLADSEMELKMGRPADSRGGLAPGARRASASRDFNRQSPGGGNCRSRFGSLRANLRRQRHLTRSAAVDLVRESASLPHL